MKKITLTFTLSQVLTCMVAFVFLFSVYSFVSSESIQSEEITVETAHSYFMNNQGSENVFGGTLKGLAVTKAQFDAMKTLNRKVGNAAGFRSYYGKDASGGNVSISVAIDASGNDILTNIQVTSADQMFSACPDYCDNESAITAQ